MLKKKWPKSVFGHELCDLLVLDEASQMNLPEAIMAALPLKADAPLIVVGDHRQMPPIVKHDWDRRGPPHLPPVSGVREPVRHAAGAEPADDPVRRELPAPCGDGRVLAAGGLPARRHRLPLEEAGRAGRSTRSRMIWSPPVLRPDYPAGGGGPRRGREPGAEPLRAGADRADPAGAWRTRRSTAWTPWTGWGSWCRTGRSGRRCSSRSRNCASSTRRAGCRCGRPSTRWSGSRAASGRSSWSAPRRATGPTCWRRAEFLLDPRRLTVALSRAKRKMILVASRSIFSLFSPDEETFANSLLWKNLLLRTCSTLLWEGERGGKRVAVWGGKASSEAGEKRD